MRLYTSIAKLPTNDDKLDKKHRFELLPIGAEAAGDFAIDDQIAL
jgi:hypothetical protein